MPFLSSPSEPRREHELRLAADTAHLHQAREYTRGAANGLGLTGRRSEELVYAVNEAVTNAIRHGRPDEDGRIRLTVALEDDAVIVTVHDSGEFTAPVPQHLEQSENGRGFTLMATFADEVRLSIGPGETAVSLCKARS